MAELDGFITEILGAPFQTSSERAATLARAGLPPRAIGDDQARRRDDDR